MRHGGLPSEPMEHLTPSHITGHDGYAFYDQRKIRHKHTNPLLLCSDTEEFLSRLFPRRKVGKSEILCQLEHPQRNLVCNAVPCAKK